MKYLARGGELVKCVLILRLVECHFSYCFTALAAIPLRRLNYFCLAVLCSLCVSLGRAWCNRDIHVPTSDRSRITPTGRYHQRCPYDADADANTDVGDNIDRCRHHWHHRRDNSECIGHYHRFNCGDYVGGNADANDCAEPTTRCVCEHVCLLGSGQSHILIRYSFWFED